MLAALWMLLWPSPATAGCDDPFVDPDDVLTLTLTTDSTTWDALTFDTIGGGCDEHYPYHVVELRCGSEAPLSIGARHKRGDQRGRDTDFKPPLKLDLNHGVSGQRWPASYGDLGFKKLSLNNGQEDNPGGVLTALLSEHLAWRLMQREVPAASGVAYAKVYVELTDLGETSYHGHRRWATPALRALIRRR